MNNKVLLQSTIIALGLEGALQAQTWDYGAATQSWTDALNWSTNAVPTTGAVTVNTATAGQTPIITTTVSRTGADTFVGNGAAGVLDINAGGSVSTSTKWIFIGNGTGGNGTLNVNSGGTLTSDNDVRLGTNPAAGFLNVNGGTVTVARVVSGTLGTISVSNGGKLTTTGTSTSNGAPDIVRLTTSSFTAGSLVSSARDIAYAAGSSSVSGGSVNATGQVFIGSGGGTSSLDMSSGTLSTGAWLVVGINNSSNGTLNVSGGTVNSSQTTGFTTVGANGNAVGLVNQTGGTWNQTNKLVLGEGGTANGTYTLGGGTLNSPLIQVGLGATATGTLNVNGGDIYTGQIAGGPGVANINLNGGTIHATGNSSSFITTASNVLAGGAKIDSNGFAISITSNLSGAGGLEKSGSGSLTLTSNSNNYTGATNVNAGSLVVNGNISTSILTTVNNGGTLSGSGTVSALTAASGGVVAPGNSPGILNAGNTDLQTGSTLTIELNGATVGTGYDQLNVTGSVNLASNLSLSLGYVPVNGALFFILANDGNDAVSGTFAGLADGSSFNVGGQYFEISYFGDSAGQTFTGGNDVVLMAVPEPSISLLGFGGALLLLRRRRN